MSVFRGDDREIDFEEEDTRNQFPDLYETEEEEDRNESEEEEDAELDS